MRPRFALVLSPLSWARYFRRSCMATAASPANPRQMDPSRLDVFMERAVLDMGAAMHAALVVIGDKLGLYKAMAGAGPITSAELAKKTNTSERYVREWLNANAASGFV